MHVCGREECPSLCAHCSYCPPSPLTVLAGFIHIQSFSDGQQKQVAKPLSPAAIPTPIHRPEWRFCCPRGWTCGGDGHTMNTSWGYGKGLGGGMRRSPHGGLSAGKGRFKVVRAPPEGSASTSGHCPTAAVGEGSSTGAGVFDWAQRMARAGPLWPMGRASVWTSVSTVGVQGGKDRQDR